MPVTRASRPATDPPRPAPPPPWLGALVGAVVALLWGGLGGSWIGLGAAVGVLAELLAFAISRSERTPVESALAFFLVSLAALGVLPFLSAGGFITLPDAVPAGELTLRLLPVPVGAGALAARHVHRARAELAERRPRGGPDPRWFLVSGALLLLVPLVLLDARLPAPYSLDFVYLVPVLGVTWLAGIRGGVMMAVFSTEARGFARWLGYPAALDPGLSALDSLVVVVGLATGAVLLGRLRERLARETDAARTDLLTGLLNRKAFLDKLHDEVARAGRYGRPLSISYIDLDGFKAVNDVYGHAAGDQVLRIVSGVLRSTLRAQDTPARLGGDEFGVLLPETPGEAAAGVMERLRLQVEERMCAFEYAVTCSVGVVTAPRCESTADELVRAADELMYEVKHGGKNALRHAVVGKG